MNKIPFEGQNSTMAKQQIDRDSALFQTIITAIQEKKGENIVSLDLRGIDEAVSDFFIICDAQTHVEVRSIADYVEHLVREELDERPYHSEPSRQWTLVDYVNVVVHVFQTEERRFYDIEGLWMDAGRMEHKD